MSTTISLVNALNQPTCACFLLTQESQVEISVGARFDRNKKNVALLIGQRVFGFCLTKPFKTS